MSQENFNESRENKVIVDDERSISMSQEYLNESRENKVIVDDERIEEYISELSLAECYQLLSALEFKNQNISAWNKAMDDLGFFRFFTKKRTKEKLRHADEDFKRIVIKLSRSLVEKIQKNLEFTRKDIINLIKKDRNMQSQLDEIRKNLSFSNWRDTIGNQKVDGKRYKDLPPYHKAFRVVADCCEYIFKDCEVEEPSIRTALDNLGIRESDRICLEEFCSLTTICQSDIYLTSFSLCENGRIEELSPYGRIIYSYPKYQRDTINKPEYSNNCEGIWELYWNKVNENERVEKEVSPTDLCINLIKDIKEVVKPSIMEMVSIKEDSNTLNLPSDDDNMSNLYLIKITPEGVSKISVDGTVSLMKGNPGKHYVVSEELKEYIENSIENWHPKAWIVGRNVLENMPAVKPRVESKAPIVYLSDYYMRLWFESCSAHVRKTNKFLAFAEYYDHSMYFQGYRLSDDGEKFSKEFTDKCVDYNKLKKNIRKSLEDMFSCEWDQIKKYRTFTVDAYLEEKLDSNKLKVYMVENSWESVLNESEEKFIEITDKLITINS